MALMDNIQSFKCPQCEFTHPNLNSLRIHCTKLHKLSSEELRIALFGRPTCECGCGEFTKFYTLQIGFSRFVNGHNARVNNGWTSEKSRRNSLKTRQGMWERGEIKPWATGKSPDHPDNVKRIKNMTAAILANPEERKRRSIQMSLDRKSGRIPTLYGKDSSQWKGGTSALQPLVRSRVFNAWTYPKLKAANFVCQQCGSKKDLEVHHDKERFAEILIKAIQTLGELGDDFSMRASLADWVADYHVTNDVSGVVLCETCHDQKHKS